MSIISIKINFNKPKIIIHPLESSLFSGESSSAENGLQIDPLSLDLVKVVKILIKVG